MYPQNSISQLLDSLRPPTQHFSVVGEKDTVVVGLSGMLIAISGNTFVNSEGEIATGKIDLNLVEIRPLSDVIGAGLQTTTGENILQTAGMIFIDAMSDGEPLRIRAEKSIVRSLQVNSIKTETFNGKKFPIWRPI